MGKKTFNFKLILIVIVSCLTGLCIGIPPTLNVPDEWIFDLQLDENDNVIKPLVITCKGDSPLTWETMVPDEYYKTEEKSSYGKYISSIKIAEPYREDTGEFTCRNARGESVSTYVYINDGKPFVSSQTHQTVNVEIGEEIYLDCRTTDPKIKVTVFKDNNEDVTNLFENDSFNRFRKVAESLQETGIYSCRDQMNPSVEITRLVNVEPRKIMQKPSIDKHRNSFHVKGVKFALNCTIPVERNDDPVIEWEVPNLYADFRQVNHRLSHFIIKELIMNNPTLDDSGDYTCKAKQGEHTVSETIKIDVQEKITPFVQFDKNNTSHEVLFVKEREQFLWILYFQGFPNNLRYQFYDPFNRTISHRRRRVSMKYEYDEGKLSFEINNTTAEDFGKYRAKLSVNGVNGAFDETTVVLVVNATPKVTFDKTPSLFSSTENVSLKTFILAYALTIPKPEVFWWLYSDCPNGVSSCDESQGTMLSHTLANEPDKPRNRFVSTVSFKPASGIVVCDVKNFFGRNSTRMQVNVSDKRKKFLFAVTKETGVVDVERKKEEVQINVIEGDDVKIECYILDFLYEDIRFSPEGAMNCNTSLSSGRCLELSNVALTQHGSHYECQAISRSTRKNETLRFTMNVIDKAVPQLLPRSNVSEEGGRISVKALDPFSIACFVEGTPKPGITWLKDGKNISDIPDFVDNEKVFLRQDSQWLEFKFAQKEYEGVYTCHAENRVGLMEPYVSLVVEGAGLSVLHWILIAAAILFILALCMIVVFLVIRIRKESKLRNELRQNQLYLFEKGNVGDLNKECTIDEQADLLPYDRAFEVERERIKLGKLLGAGAFGRVMQAEVEDLEEEGKTTRVAVKMVKDGADMAHLRALTLELKIMVHLGKHLNIVNLMGAHTENMKKGDLWILVEYCKYGNLLKHIKKYKPRFINQIDPVTGLIDIHYMTQSPHESFSPTSLGRHSQGFGRSSAVDADGYLETRSHTGSMRGTRPVTRNTSITSNSGASSRPGMYVGNPHYATVGFAPSSQTSQSTAPHSEGTQDHYVIATHLPPPHSSPNQETSTSSPNSDSGYHMTLNTEMTTVSSPPPFSPASTTSEHSFFSSSEYGEIPGVSAPFTTSQIVCWAWQVANGMEYLTKRKVLHGDLAARNILLAAHNVVKISDFGLSRDIYKTDIYMKQGDEIMPIKWMAPEAIQQKCFSIQSDVWAFGVTLWELFTLGNAPYPGIPLNQDFLVALENGMRMEKPKYSNDELYDLMMQCWKLNPLQRPNFSKMAEMLSEMLSPESRENYVAMNDVLMRRNEEWLESKEDYLTMVTSPDFQNINGPLSDETYIPMETIREHSNQLDGSPPSGYLDMKSVRSSPTPHEAIFSPRPLLEEKKEEDGIFSFSGDQIALTDDQQSPAETSNLIQIEEDQPAVVQTPNQLRNNNNNHINNINNINKLNSLNEMEQQPLYQNLSKVALNNKQNTLESYIEQDCTTDEDDTKRHYINLPQHDEQQYMGNDNLA